MTIKFSQAEAELVRRALVEHAARLRRDTVGMTVVAVKDQYNRQADELDRLWTRMVSEKTANPTAKEYLENNPGVASRQLCCYCEAPIGDAEYLVDEDGLARHFCCPVRE